MSPAWAFDAERARAAAESAGTPCYVQDLSRVRRQYRRLRAALPAACDILYACKANPHADILACLVTEGAGVEVASLGELERAKTAGAAAGMVAYAGPAKRDEELKAALEFGLTLNVESAGELMRAEAVAVELGIERAVSVRVNPPWGVEEERPILGGNAPTKFGVDLEQLPAFVEAAKSLKKLRVRGLHVFAATNVLDADALAQNAGRILDLAKELQDVHGLPMETIDFGGGLGVAYEEGRAELDVERFGAELGRILEERFGGSPPRLILEPGRWLVAESGVFLTRVIDRKSCRDIDYVLCDGGINHLLRPALIGQAHPTWIVGREGDSADAEYEIGGPLCTSLDTLGKNVPLPNPQPGDLLAIGCAGAYGYTESMLHFLSHALPAQVMQDDRSEDGVSG
jgi:diaminopimelate decarboxylase